MKYSKGYKTFTVVFHEEVEAVEGEPTKVLIHVNLKDHTKFGMSQNLLNEIINHATRKLSKFRIHHDDKGLSISGEY